MTFPVFIKASRTRLSISKEIREVNRLRTRYEKSMTSRLMGVFRKVGQRAAAEYEQTGGFTNAMRPMRGELEQVFRAHYTAVIEKFADRVYDNRKQERFSQFVFQYYEQFAGEKIRGITATTGRQILQAIKSGENEGEGVDAIAKLIKQKTGGAVGRARAATIARTETHAAASYATHTATKELNLPAQRKRWVSVSDGRTRDHHAAANGQEVGIDEKFIIRFRGAEIEMEYPHDGSGGAANNINCRCLALYFTDEDALFDSFGDEAPTPVEVPDIEEVQPQLDEIPAAVVANFVRDKAITADTLPAIGKAKATRELDAALKAGHIDVEYADEWDNIGTNWRGIRSSSDLGKSGLRSFSQRAVEMVSYVHTVELAKLAQKANVPNLRRIQSARSKNINGSMGGGVMNLQKDAIEAYVTVGVRRNIDDISADMTEARKARGGPKEDLDDFMEAQRDAGVRFSEYRQSEEYARLWRAYEIADDRYQELYREYKEARDAASRGAGLLATYRIGDDIKDRPWSTKEYFPDGLDKVRSLMYHEFGHHIHQIRGLDADYAPLTSPIEKRLDAFWKSTARSEKEYWSPSTYAMSNEKEYFVESLVMYLFDRKDMIHPQMIELIDEVLGE